MGQDVNTGFVCCYFDKWVKHNILCLGECFVDLQNQHINKTAMLGIEGKLEVKAMHFPLKSVQGEWGEHVLVWHLF